jgi:hypothetical protein
VSGKEESRRSVTTSLDLNVAHPGAKSGKDRDHKRERREIPVAMGDGS